MVGQQAFGWWLTNDGLGLQEVTVQVPKRDTFAEVALTRLNDISEGDGIWGPPSRRRRYSEVSQ